MQFEQQLFYLLVFLNLVVVFYFSMRNNTLTVIETRYLEKECSLPTQVVTQPPSPSPTQETQLPIQEAGGIYPLFKLMCRDSNENAALPAILDMRDPVPRSKRRLMVDVGANTGLEYRAGVQKGFTVVSLEASPRTFRDLVRTSCKPPCVNISSLDQLRPDSVRGLQNGSSMIINAAVGASRSVMTLYDSPSSPMSSLAENFDGKGQAVQVQVVPLSDIIHEDVFFLKIDVQGFEYEVLRGAEKLFRDYTVAVMLLELYPNGLGHAGVNMTEMLTLVRDTLGMVCSTSHRSADSLAPDHPTGRREFAKYVESNYNSKDKYGLGDDLICFNVRKPWRF